MTELIAQETSSEVIPEIGNALGLALMQALNDDVPQKQPRRKKVKKQYPPIEWATQPANCYEEPYNPLGLTSYDPSPEELFGPETLAKLQAAETYVDETNPEQEPELDFTHASAEAYETYADYEPMSYEDELRELRIGDLLEEERIAQYHQERIGRRKFRVVRTRKIIKDEYGRTIRSTEMNERLRRSNKSRPRSSYKEKHADDSWEKPPGRKTSYTEDYALPLEHRKPELREEEKLKYLRPKKIHLTRRMLLDQLDLEIDPDFEEPYELGDRHLSLMGLRPRPSELLRDRVTFGYSGNMSTQDSSEDGRLRTTRRGYDSAGPFGHLDSDLFTQTYRRYQQNANREG